MCSSDLQHQVVNSQSVQSTSDTTSINSKPPCNHCPSCGQLSSEVQQLKLTIDSLVTRIGLLEQTVSSQKALIDQHGHGISVRNSLINANSTTSSLSSMDIADKHTTKSSHSDVLKIPKVSAKQQALSRQSSNNEPSIPNTFMAHDSKADNSKNVPSINQSNSSRTQNKSPASVFKPDQCIIISINKVYATTHNFNQDGIHKEINHAYEPMIIERITPYKYISDFLKVCLQLSRSETAKHVASAWKSD